MKNRIALLVLALVCLIGLFAMTATADEAPTASIAGHNLSLNDNIYIIYYAEFENLPVGAEKGVLVWTSQQESYEYGTQYAILPVYTGNNYDYDAYYFTGVSAKMMTQDIYAKAYVKVGDEITYSELDKYSVLQYCYNKKDSTTTLDDSTITLGELIQDILHYGASAQKYFNFNTDRLATADYYEIKVVNGMLPDTTKSGLFQLSEQVTLTASIENFDHWENLAGETVGTEATLVVTVAGAETYTAIEKGPELVYSEGLEFVSNGDGTCYVAGIGTCTDTDIRIPPVSPEGDSVTSIGYRAFRDCKALTSITIPNSVTSIGYYAFQYCTSLTSIEIPDSVTSIGSSVFSGCSALQSMTIPFVGNRAGVTAEDTYQYPFGYLFGTSYTDGTETTQYYYGSSTSSTIFSDYYIPTSLKSVTVTGGYIPYGAFYNCSNLTSVTLGDSVTSIGRYAFCRSSSLTSVTIGNSVTSIGEYAFYNCSSLTSIEIPAGVTSIERYAFEGCSNLQYNTYSKAKYLGNAENPYVVLMNATNTSITSCKIHSNTKIIYGYAFQNCDSLTSVTIGDSVTSIGDSVFRGCSSLTSIEIPDGVTSIGNYAFYYCSSLTSIEIPDGVTSIGNYAFYYCSSLTSIEIPDSVTSIGKYAFENCSSLTSIEIGDSVTSIGERVFYNCSSLTSVHITDLASWCGISFEGSVANPLYYAHNLYLNGELLTEFEIPDSVTSIGNYAFFDCRSLTSIEIPDSVTSIGDYAFSGCTSLTSIEIPDKVTSIGDSAFRSCSSLTSVEIPGSVTSIGRYAFSGCTSLTSIEIPDSVTSIGGFAFSGCSNLQYNTYSKAKYLGNADNPYVALIQANSSSSASCKIHPDTKVIAGSAFGGCYSLTSIEIPDSVTSIGERAFSGCTSLTSITIGDSVTSIGYEAFSGCTSLTSIEIPDSVTSIGERAFYNCSSLTSIEIQDKVTSIGSYTFYNCSSLTSVHITDLASWCGILFGNSFANPLYYAHNLYLNGELLTDLVIPDSVTSIEGYAFHNRTSLTSIEIPDSVTSIGAGAFAMCSSLTSITYTGTKAQWNAISKGSYWNSSTGSYTIHCTDGDISKQ